jgi:hypothetical protein
MDVAYSRAPIARKVLDDWCQARRCEAKRKVDELLEAQASERRQRREDFAKSPAGIQQELDSRRAQEYALTMFGDIDG